MNRLARTLSGQNAHKASGHAEGHINSEPIAEEQGSQPAKTGPFARLKKLVTKAKDPSTAFPGEELEDDLDFSEPSILAQKIRDLIEAIPTPSTGGGPFPKPKAPACDKTGRPIPPSGANRIHNAKLMSLLTDPQIMNGAEEDKASIWSILDSWGPPRHTDGGDDGSRKLDKDTSIMLYSPFFPTKDSVVEIAEVQVIDTSALTEVNEELQVLSWWKPHFWPFTGWNGDKTEKPVEPTPAPAPAPTIPKQVKVWVPSKEKLSFQVMWWGYRIFLPPPVMNILDDKTLEASKRAAMITTALAWFFSNIPLAAVPLPIQPVVMLLQKIVPYVGYVGTFISWSWSTVKSYDVGHGTYLTATWLLPVALIPGTWHDYDFPEPKPEPVPAPPAESTPTPSPETKPTPVPEVKPIPTPTPAPPSDNAPVPTPAPAPEPPAEVPAPSPEADPQRGPAPVPTPDGPGATVPGKAKAKTGWYNWLSG